MVSSALYRFIGRSLLMTAVLALVLWPLAPVMAQATEEVSSFSSDIVVGEDGSVSVTEQIDYTFVEPRHGIYRDIPFRYVMDNGEEVIVPVEIVSVEGGPYKIEKSRTTMRLRIGDPDKTVTGRKSYVIKYIATGALRYFDDHDEIYWNVTGNEWQVPLKRVSAQVHLPEGARRESINMTCYTGPAGSTENDCLYHRANSGASFAANKPLTIVVGWEPTGLVAKVEPLKPSFYSDYVEPYLAQILFSILVPLGVFIYMFRKWRNQGRDPRGRGTLMVQYEQPDELTPAEIGLLMDEQVDVKDISATIVDLAVRGYIKIVELPKKFLTGRDFEFVQLKKFVDDVRLKQHEKIVLETVFNGRDTVRLKTLVSEHAFHNDRKKINRALYEDSVTRGYFDKNPNKVRQKYLLVGAIVLIGGVLIGLFGAPLIISGLMIMGFGRAMPKKTRDGVRAYEHAQGFREYLDKAEKYRIQWQEKERIFEQFLPYAMVYGVTDHWTEAFKNIDLPPPDWYQGPAGAQMAGQFNAVNFVSAISGLESGLQRAVSSRPQKSSGGSGFSGGSSGGGFGGGGGGSW